MHEDGSRCYEDTGKSKSNGLSAAQDLKTDEIIRAIEGLTMEHMQPHKVNVKIEVPQSSVTNSVSLVQPEFYIINTMFNVSEASKNYARA